jgi:phosphoserine phosphatase
MPGLPSSRPVAAFFDIDGTLLPDPSLEWHFIAYLLAHDDLGLGQLGRWFAALVRQFPYSPRVACRENKSYLRGLPDSLPEMWLRSLVWSERSVNDDARPGLGFFAEGLYQIEWHATRNHKIFLLSGTLAPLARIAAARISLLFGCAIEVVATELEVRHGIFSGKLAGPHISREQKALSVKRSADRYDLSLGESFAYANSFDDLAMLESVGRPRAVNPDRKLCRHAARLHWPVLHWRSLETPLHSCSSSTVHAGETR